MTRRGRPEAAGARREAHHHLARRPWQLLNTLPLALVLLAALAAPAALAQSSYSQASAQATSSTPQRAGGFAGFVAALVPPPFRNAGGNAAGATSARSSASSFSSSSPAIAAAPQRPLAPMNATHAAWPSAASAASATAATGATTHKRPMSLPNATHPVHHPSSSSAWSSASATATATAAPKRPPCPPNAAIPVHHPSSTSSPSSAAASATATAAAPKRPLYLPNATIPVHHPSSTSSWSSASASATAAAAAPKRPPYLPNATLPVHHPSSTSSWSSSAAAAPATGTGAGAASASTTASATVGDDGGAPAVPLAEAPCNTVTQTSSSSCASGVCCAVRQRVTMCASHTTALAEINGRGGACCIVLASRKTGAPTAFCSTPSPKPGARRFPPGVAVSLLPECVAGRDGAAHGVLSCEATLPQMPRGFALPDAHRDGGALTLSAGKAAPWAGAELAPCGNRAYGGFSQTAAVDDVTGAVTLRVTCN